MEHKHSQPLRGLEDTPLGIFAAEKQRKEEEQRQRRLVEKDEDEGRGTNYPAEDAWRRQN